MIKEINAAVGRRIRKDSGSFGYRLGTAKSTMWPHYPNDRCTPHDDLICICPARAPQRCPFSSLPLPPPPFHPPPPPAPRDLRVRPYSPANASSQRRADRCNHVEDILPVNAAGAARSFRQMICQSVISSEILERLGPA